MKWNTLLIITVTLSLNSCERVASELQDSHTLITSDELAGKLNAYKRISTANNELIEFSIQFFNNPYHLDSTYHLIVIVSGAIVYSGNFDRYISIQMPEKFFNMTNDVEFLLNANEQAYFFDTMQVVELNNSDDLMQIVFLPEENDWFTFYFNFTNSNKSQESP